MTFRSNYWSCSKFAAWLRSLQGISSPYALSMEDWEAYKKEHKHKLCYKLAEWLDNVQDVVCFPMDVAHKTKYTAHNLWIGTHCLKTSLKKGQWHEFEKRVKHSLMENFISFMEDEVYHNTLMWNKEHFDENGIDTDLHTVLKFWQELQDNGREEKPWKEILDAYYKCCYILRERGDVWDKHFETYKEYMDLEAQQDKEDEDVLVAIIKFRKFLWT